MQHDPSTENGQARWRLYHWVTYLLWNTADSGAPLSFPASASLSSHLPFSFSFPGLFMGFFSLDHDSQGYCAVKFFFGYRYACLCEHSHLCACEVFEAKWEFFSGLAWSTLISSPSWSHFTYHCYYCWCSDPQQSWGDRFPSSETQVEFHPSHLFTRLICTSWTQQPVRAAPETSSSSWKWSNKASWCRLTSTSLAPCFPFVLLLSCFLWVLPPLMGSLFFFSSCHV